jgi:hypothetical protein
VFSVRLKRRYEIMYLPLIGVTGYRSLIDPFICNDIHNTRQVADLCAGMCALCVCVCVCARSVCVCVCVYIYIYICVYINYGGVSESSR